MNPLMCQAGTQSNGRFLVRADGILSARGLQRTHAATGAMGGLMQRLSAKHALYGKSQ